MNWSPNVNVVKQTPVRHLELGRGRLETAGRLGVWVLGKGPGKGGGPGEDGRAGGTVFLGKGSRAPAVSETYREGQHEWAWLVP